VRILGKPTILVSITIDNDLLMKKKKQNGSGFIYCLIGNIVESRLDENLKKTVFGTKYFAPHAKVYCYPAKWGDGYEKITVTGRHRVSGRLITIVMASKLITNWRLSKVYNPAIIKKCQRTQVGRMRIVTKKLLIHC